MWQWLVGALVVPHSVPYDLRWDLSCTSRGASKCAVEAKLVEWWFNADTVPLWHGFGRSLNSAISLRVVQKQYLILVLWTFAMQATWAVTGLHRISKRITLLPYRDCLCQSTKLPPENPSALWAFLRTLRTPAWQSPPLDQGLASRLALLQSATSSISDDPPRSKRRHSRNASAYSQSRSSTLLYSNHTFCKHPSASKAHAHSQIPWIRYPHHPLV